MPLSGTAVLAARNRLPLARSIRQTPGQNAWQTRNDAGHRAGT
ncbi:hypothetical protein OQ252_10155 [Acetobacter farinalis]|uniref:Uncharacterized protein n=1 Tax=Acetobacter farinalis TaxID=1260984 RepID=A0ABT3Q8Y1_9PROT|nr:hypothetical protein [Acetobacter farinalis]MCX2561755.1 hypothetical protein [Acetobacter farinalis]